jgi:hypothetical protein
LFEGYLNEALAAPANGRTAPTTAMMQVWYLGGGLIDAGYEVEITNRDETLSIDSGDYLVALPIGAELRPIWT